MSPNTNFDIAFTKLYAVEQTTDGGDSDEPYVVFLTVDMMNGQIPSIAVTRTKVFQDVDDNETRVQHVSLWGTNQSPQPIADPSKVIFLAALMENDEATATHVVNLVRDKMFVRVLSLVSANYPRSELVGKLIAEFDSSLTTAAHASNDDDRMGKAQELRIARSDLKAATTKTVTRHLDFESRDLDGAYRVSFAIKAV